MRAVADLETRPGVSPPRIAILLACFEGERWLGEQLKTLLAQRGVAVTVFASVDPSCDGTEALLRRAGMDDPRIVLLPVGERFGGAALNFFRLFRDVDLAGYNYVALSDQDDVWSDTKLLRAHEVLQACNAAAYSSNVTALWPSGRQALIHKAQPQRRWDFLFEAAGPGCTYVLCAGLALRFQALIRERWCDVRKVGLHDWFLYAFARAQGDDWVIDERPSMLYRQHADNQVGVNRGLKAFRHRARKVLDGWAIEQAVLISRLVGLGEDSTVRRWFDGGRRGLLALAFNARDCRRRHRDQLWFFGSCLVNAFRMRKFRSR